MVLNVIFLLGLLVAVGEMKQSVKTVEGLEEFRVTTTATLAVACRNIEYLTKNVDYLIEKDRALRTGSAITTQAPKYDEIRVGEQKITK
jgi:hypothetical protein